MTKIVNELTKEIKDEIAHDNLVIFPTETVYGIGANALSENAVNKIFEVNISILQTENATT